MSFQNPYFADFGSVSSATMRPEDLIPTFLDALDDEKERRSLHTGCEDFKDDFGRLDSLMGDIERRIESVDYYESEQPVWDIETLADELNEFAPPYAHFGSHPGNGSDYGFWLLDDIAEDFDGLSVADTSDVPDDYRGEVLHSNDHGNLTLYVADEDGLHEVWAIV